MGRRSKVAKYETRGPQGLAPLVPLTERQEVLIRSIYEKQMVVVTGPAGTGKTYVPAVMAADYLRHRTIDRIILTRPNVAAGRSLGYRPGDLKEKLSEWFAEIRLVMRERLGATFFEYAEAKGQIEMVPFESMRGRSFNNAFVILDEAQNTTLTEMKMFTTRLGENTKVVVNGDVRQSDLDQTSGLYKLCSLIHDRDMDVPIINFGVDDIVRSGLCREFVLGWMSAP